MLILFLIYQLEKRCAMAENMWKVFWYSLLLTMPATLAFIINFKLNVPYGDFMVNITDSICLTAQV